MVAKKRTIMKNIVLISKKSPQKEIIQRAAKLIQNGELVAFPTETVYGLGANVFDTSAIKQIFTAKGRPADNPLIVHIARKKDVALVAKQISHQAKKLMRIFWPGPLTFVLKKKKSVPAIVTCELDTVAVRMPKHPVALALIKAAKCPIAAPSANISGKPSSTSARHVAHDFGSTIKMILDAGKTSIGLESTVIDVTAKKIIVLRPGGITIEQLTKALGYKPEIASHTGKKIRSPGMKYRHYAPKVPLFVTEKTGQAMVGFLQKKIITLQKKGLRVGVLSYFEHKKFYSRADKIIACGSQKKPQTIAKNLYACLRLADPKDIDVLLAEHFGTDGIQYTVMQRLLKAATEVLK